MRCRLTIVTDELKPELLVNTLIKQYFHRVRVALDPRQTKLFAFFQ